MRRADVEKLMVGDVVRTTSFGKVFVVSGFMGNDVMLKLVSERGTVLKYGAKVSRSSLLDNGFELVPESNGVVM